MPGSEQDHYLEVYTNALNRSHDLQHLNKVFGDIKEIYFEDCKISEWQYETLKNLFETLNNEFRVKTAAEKAAAEATKRAAEPRVA